MNFTIMIVALLGSFSIFAQSQDYSSGLEGEKFKIINSTYPDESISVECHSSKCETIDFYKNHKGKKIYINTLYAEDYFTDSNKEVGRRYFDLDCKENFTPGAPCFSLIKGTPYEVNKSFKEGRGFEGVLKIIAAPAFVLLDLITTVTIVPSAVLIADSIKEAPGQITRKDRRIARRKLRKANYILKKLRQVSKDKVLRVKDRIYGKILWKLKKLPYGRP